MEGFAPSPVPATGPGARSTPTARITQPSGQLRGTTTRATSATPAAPSPEVEAQIQRLLAQHIGPMAKIIYARAQKSETTGEGVIKSVAQSIDDDAGRAAFLADATKVLRGKRL
jgi:hypothetical protein